MRKAIVLALLAALVVPAAALGATPTRTDRAHAFGDCAILKERLGPRTFRATYRPAAGSTRNAFGRCVAQWARAEAANRVHAARACSAERAGDPAAFHEQYGAGSNAYGACVASKRRHASRVDRRDTVTAAWTCKAARRDDADAFATDWGSGRRAFGKCVSATARASQAS